jgi:hypothetical protein
MPHCSAKFLSLRLFAVIWMLAMAARVGGQEIKSAGYLSSADSLAADGSDETLYQIDRLRFERWAIANTEKLADPLLLQEVVRLKKEAEGFAENGDFTLALIWMETIWDLLEPTPGEESIENGPKPWHTIDELDELTLLPSQKFRWTRELMTGIDVWRQEFQFTFLEGDSSFLEGSSNPFSGVRAAFEYNPAPRRFFQLLTFFKYSRDYLFGDLEIRARNPLGPHSLWRIENRFEGSSFYRDFDVKYLQNRTTLALDLRRLGPLSFDLRDELLIRNYANSTSSYPNYLSNMLTGFVKFHTNLGSYIGAGYRNTIRNYPDFDVNNYHENRFDFSWYQSLGRELSFGFENELYYRDYTNSPADTIFQDYLENYFRGQMKIPFTSVLGSEVDGSVSRRDYSTLSLNFPDYWLWEIEPTLYLKINRQWQVAAGAYYSELVHQRLTTRVPPTSASDAISILFEDYYMYGPTFTVDFFQINGVILNMQQSFLWQRYPKSRQNNVTNVAIYSDRQIYSILLFLTWNISPKWRFTALANMDDDRSRHDESSDSNNTLVGLEVNYSF